MTRTRAGDVALPKICVVCGDRRVAWTTPRVDYCYECLPGGPFTPPPCRACGSDRYYSSGLCTACHPRGPDRIESCVGCLAWGVTRLYRSRCWSCRWWHCHYPHGTCACCGRDSVISERRCCRLCFETARVRQQPGRQVDLANATRFGQQLFLANTQTLRQAPHHRAPHTPAAIERRRPLPRIASIGHDLAYTPVAWEQLTLFDIRADPVVIATRTGRADSELMSFCDQVVRDHAVEHGWSRKQTNDVRRSLRLVEALQHTPGGTISASAVVTLPALQANVSVISTLDVLAAAGLLHDDRLSPVERYFNNHTGGLPEPMTNQLRVKFDEIINGSTQPPRRHPRDPETARLHIAAIAPIARYWAARGIDTFAEIDRDDIITMLPAASARRHSIEQGLRSLFTVLKGRKLVFINPTRAIPATGTNPSIPLPLDTTAIREALESSDAAAALAVALVAFHAIPSRHLRVIQLTDIIDARLTVAGREFPLAAPVLPRLAAWLDHRNTRWPNTMNPHLFINRRTAPRLIAVSRSFAWDQTGLTSQALREDRILDEVNATGGDIPRICELFGINVDTALRYTRTLEPDLPPADPT